MKSIATFVIGLFLCGSVFAETHVVQLNAMSFSPNEITVVPGDVIRWEYNTGYPHTVTSGSKCMPDSLFHYEDMNSPGDVAEWIVPSDAPVEIPYFCKPHCGNGMTAMIYVEGDSDEGRMSIGIIDISSCDVNYIEGGGEAEILIASSDYISSFAWGVEIEDGDIEVIVYSSGAVYLHDASDGTSSPCPSGTYTLLDGQKYMFHGSNEFVCGLTWPEQGDEEGMGMSIAGTNVSIHSASSDGDNVSFRAPGTGVMSLYLTAEVDMQVSMAVIANVTCSSLTLPASGEEADVEVPVGTHEIVLNGDGTGMGMLLMQMGDGDDGGGSCLPEDVNNDGVVNVSDLLAIIAVWGVTCP